LKWHTASFGTAEEITEKEALEATITEFWQKFSAQSAAVDRAFRQQEKQNLVETISAMLQTVHPKMMWEISRDPLPSADNLVFTVTAGDNFGLRPLSKAIVDAAPAINGWRVSEFKVPLGGYTVTSQTGISRDYIEATGKLSETPYGCFNLTVRSKHFKKANDPADWEDVYLICPARFGEEMFEIWLDWILTEPEPVATRSTYNSIFGRRSRKAGETKTIQNQSFQPLEELVSSMNLAVAEKVDKLPAEPCWARQFASTNVIISEKPQETARFSYTTPYPEVIMAYENRYSFHSANFTRYEEKFAYLKMVGSFSEVEDLKTRYELEEELDRQLRDRQAGCVIGGGVGTGVSFIDLMISDLPAAIHILRAECNRVGVPETSWLLFLDTYWADEWVGMAENSPTPPPRVKKCW
jgi:hypothetical protein